MVFKTILSKNNEKMWSAKPHVLRFIWLYIPRAIFWEILLLILFGTYNAVNFWLAFGIVLAMLIIVLIYTYFLWKTYDYYITTEGIFHKSGILYKVTKFVPFYKITNFSKTEGIFQQSIGLASLNIHTAGMPTTAPEVVIQDIYSKDAENVMDIIKTQIKAIEKK